MRNALPDDPLLPEIAKLLPVMARLLDRQLRTIEHTPSRRHGLPVAIMLQQSRVMREIIAGLDAIIEIQDAIAAQPEILDDDAEREALRQELDRINAAERRIMGEDAA